MADHSNVPKILPANAPVMGQNIEIVADADPTHFPHGLQLIIMAPGNVKPLGGGPIPPGTMLAIINVEMAKALRAVYRQATQQRPAPGEIKPPGVH